MPKSKFKDPERDYPTDQSQNETDIWNLEQAANDENWGLHFESYQELRAR